MSYPFGGGFWWKWSQSWIKPQISVKAITTERLENFGGKS